jgi:hypothetical protein
MINYIVTKEAGGWQWSVEPFSGFQKLFFSKAGSEDIPSGNQTSQASRKFPMKMDVHKWEHHGIFQQAMFEDTGENHHKRLITSLYNVPTNYQSMR